MSELGNVSAIFERDFTACSLTTVSSVEHKVSKRGSNASLLSKRVKTFPNSSAIANNTSSSSFLIKSMLILESTIEEWNKFFVGLWKSKR